MKFYEIKYQHDNSMGVQATTIQAVNMTQAKEKIKARFAGRKGFKIISCVER